MYYILNSLKVTNPIGGVMVSVHASSVVDREFDSNPIASNQRL
jgi:hypothetical protein